MDDLRTFYNDKKIELVDNGTFHRSSQDDPVGLSECFDTKVQPNIIRSGVYKDYLTWIVQQHVTTPDRDVGKTSDWASWSVG